MTIAEYVVLALLFVVVGRIFMLLNRLGDVQNKEGVDRALRGLWPTYGAFLIVVGAFLDLHGEWFYGGLMVGTGIGFAAHGPVTDYYRRRYRGAMSEPIPPENVRIELPDGTVLPVELSYVGKDDGGLHQWVAVPTSPAAVTGGSLLVDKFPPRTAITVKVRPSDT